MRKIAISALGVLVSVLASPTAVGQEKPKVQVEKPKVVLPVKVPGFDESGRARLDRLLEGFKVKLERKGQVLPLDIKVNTALREAQLRHAFQLNQAQIRLTALRVNGTIVRQGREPEPLMQGDLKTTIEEIQRVLRVVRVGDLTQGLAALDVVKRGIMKARRLLRTQKDLTETPSEDEVRALTQMQYFTAFLQQSNPTPLDEAESALKQAIVSVRKATDIEEAKKALDEVEKSLAALRALLWEKKSSKKD